METGRSPASLFAGAAACGVLSHHLVFKRFYVDKHALEIGISTLCSPFVLTRLLPAYSIPPYALSFALVITYSACLFTSIIVYRAFLHPLRTFPGPVGARISKFYAFNKARTTQLKWYQVSAELHKKYGDYVRIGPRELSIIDPKAIQLILGFSSKTFKAPFYDAMEESVSTTRDKVFHKQRRKVWDSSVKQLLTSYSPTLEQFTDVLLGRLESNQGNPVLVNELAIHYSYDVMHQLAFGDSGGFISGKSSETSREALNGIQNAVDAIGLFNNVPWLMKILATLGAFGGPLKAYNDWTNSTLTKRRKNGSKNPDLMGELIANTTPDKKGNGILFSEARLILGAGSDTTANALSETFIVLAHRTEYVDRIRAEIDPAIKEGSFSCQISYPILDGVINEILRMYPPVLFASSRLTPPEGLQIGDVYIPADTIVCMPAYQLHRDPRNFVEPENFIPERWSAKSEMVLNRSAFIPFLIGPGNCPGKPLAMMELRSVIARTLHKFDVSFPEGVVFEQAEFFKKVKDHFIAGCPKQELVFTKRRGL